MRLGSWRFWMGMEAQSPEERTATRNALSLFFGALIGANLGSLEALPLIDYTVITVAVGGVVFYMQLVPVAEKRWLAVLNAALLLGALYLLLLTPLGLQMLAGGATPKPHLFVTLCLWIGLTFLTELRPVRRQAMA